jgi:uncharacterized protein YsxB (DUF464 family)
MIEVDVKYFKMKAPSRGSDKFFRYTHFSIKGHADNLDATSNIKVCSAITACCEAIYYYLYEEGEMSCKFKLEKGLFEYGSYEDSSVIKLPSYSCELMYGLNTLLCVLALLHEKYPQAFSKFSIVNVKEN